MACDRFELQHLAVPAVVVLIASLSYGPQVFLFPFLEPGDLSTSQKWKFNLLLGSIWVSYYRAVRTNPGDIPKMSDNKAIRRRSDSTETENITTETRQGTKIEARQRWCRKCESVKPARAHHCKICKRCIPKMDHHCPWTANCVSHFTLPHFMRFLFYATTSMVYLQYFFFIRAAIIWDQRKLPSYMGPSTKSFVLMFVFVIVNSLTLFAVGVMFLRSLYDVVINTTTIESWEISRHHQLLRRARALGGFLYGPDGQKIVIQRQEFPYDIGIWANLCQAMGTANPLVWFWVFSRSRRASPSEGLTWPTNGFEDEHLGWPPPDPDRMPRMQPWGSADGGAFTHEGTHGYGELSPREEIEAFRRRQESDLQRQEWRRHDGEGAPHTISRRKKFHERFDDDTYEQLSDLDVRASEPHTELDDQDSGEEGWRDSSGSRLKDYGVDEDVEFYDEDDIPLAELLRRRNDSRQQTRKHK